MSKKRLEKAKKILNHIKGYGIYDGNDDIEIFEWLIEQAEQVQKLNEEHEKYVNFVEDYNANTVVEFNKLIKQNKRYREALEFYADEETYETKFATDTDEICDTFTLIELDEGKKARKALEGEE